MRPKTITILFLFYQYLLFSTQIIANCFIFDNEYFNNLMGGIAEKCFFKSGVDKVKSSIPQDLWSLSIKDIEGNSKTLADYKTNKSVFVFVNVACKCGLTGDQYTELVELYNKYSDKGLQILGFPCGQFMNQEYATEKEIKEFVDDKFKVEFPLMSKIEVNGDNMNDIYKYLKYNCEDMKTKEGGLKNVPWNFGKFLVDENGKVIKFYSPKIKPNEMEEEIKKRLH